MLSVDGRQLENLKGELLKLKKKEAADCQLWHNVARTEERKKQKNKEIADCQAWHNVASVQLTSFLARTADRTPKTFALQGDPSRSTHTPSSKRSPYIVSRGRPRRHMESSSTFKLISSTNRDIEKIPAPLRSHISSPKSGVQTWLLSVISYLPL
ncbi:hypothetical protein AVEN_204638-1 [Araneus ventricosus]|uniref:Uncharacterized protein n=1 Tax=Araneus ventricosus TaxID=182803 RepID=A0A4Y2VKQ6_ARAVE|nr:hypothetical protein AVEN_204638-1 [Araneus ventricosus]